MYPEAKWKYMSIWMLWCKVKIRQSWESSHEGFLVSMAIRCIIDLGCFCIPCWLIKLLSLNWPSRLLRAIPGRWYTWVINPWKREGKQKGDITRNKACSTKNKQVCLIYNHKMARVTSLLTGNAYEKIILNILIFIINIKCLKYEFNNFEQLKHIDAICYLFLY